MTAQNFGDLFDDLSIETGLLAPAGDTPRTREEIYDAEIAPLLRQVAEVCAAHGMSLVGLVEYDQHDAGGTYWTEPDASDYFHRVREAAMSYGRDFFVAIASHK